MVEAAINKVVISQSRGGNKIKLQFFSMNINMKNIHAECARIELDLTCTVTLTDNYSYCISSHVILFKNVID